MLTRDEFVALLARLRGDGDPITAAELASMSEYAAANADDRAAVSDSELEEVEATLMALGADDTVSLDTLEAAADAVEAIRTVGVARDEADAAEATRREAVLARLAGPEPEVVEETPAETPPVAETPEEEVPAEGDEPPAETPAEDAPAEDEVPAEAELVGATAAAPARRAPGQLRNRRPAGATQAPARRAHNRILRDGGGEFADLAEVGEAMVEARRRFLHANNGVSEMMTLASIEAEYAPEHILDPYRTAEQLAAVTAAFENLNGEQYDAVTAAGFCAPTEPYYGIMQLAGSGRPFRAGLQQRNAGRGRITYRVPPDFPDFQTAIGVWNNDNATSPGDATKPCLAIPCPDTDDAEIYAVTECLTFENFMARTDPESVANAVANTAAAFARKAETLLIDAMKAGSKAITGGDALGAYRDLVYHMGVAGAGYRSRHRMDRNAVLEVRLPAWVYDMVLLDLTRSLPGDGVLVAGEDVFNRAMARHNLRLASLYIDSPTTGPGQVFGPQAAGQAIVDFPSAVQWQISAPGTWVLLDNGRLDLGVVRDSVLNSTNTFQTFAETFEGIAMLGLESLWVTSSVCPNGASAGTIDPSSFCTGDYVPV